MADTVITPDQVIADFGAYYIDAGQNQNSLMMRPFVPFETLEAFTVIPTEDTILRMSDVQVGEILQAYQDEYTPKGSVTFAPITVNMFEQKIDQAFNPTKLVRTWIGFLTSNNVDRTSWPFVRWFIEQYLLKQVDKDLEMQAIYKGAYVAPTTGTAGAAINSMNGVKKIINDAITGSAITPIPTGAPATDPQAYYEQIEAWVKLIDELYRDEVMVLNMSKNLALRFQEGKRKKFNMYYSQEADLKSVALFPNITVEGRRGMTGSNKIWMTPRYNAIAAVKGYSNKNAFEMEKVDRKVKIYTDWFLGVGFLLKDLIFTNDQDLT